MFAAARTSGVGKGLRRVCATIYHFGRRPVSGRNSNPRYWLASDTSDVYLNMFCFVRCRVAVPCWCWQDFAKHMESRTKLNVVDILPYRGVQFQAGTFLASVPSNTTSISVHKFVSVSCEHHVVSFAAQWGVRRTWAIVGSWRTIEVCELCVCLAVSLCCL